MRKHYLPDWELKHGLQGASQQCQPLSHYASSDDVATYGVFIIKDLRKLTKGGSHEGVGMFALSLDSNVVLQQHRPSLNQ